MSDSDANPNTETIPAPSDSHQATRVRVEDDIGESSFVTSQQIVQQTPDRVVTSLQHQYCTDESSDSDDCGQYLLEHSDVTGSALLFRRSMASRADSGDLTSSIRKLRRNVTSPSLLGDDAASEDTQLQAKRLQLVHRSSEYLNDGSRMRPSQTPPNSETESEVCKNDDDERMIPSGDNRAHRDGMAVATSEDEAKDLDQSCYAAEQAVEPPEILETEFGCVSLDDIKPFRRDFDSLEPARDRRRQFRSREESLVAHTGSTDVSDTEPDAPAAVPMDMASLRDSVAVAAPVAPPRGRIASAQSESADEYPETASSDYDSDYAQKLFADGKRSAADSTRGSAGGGKRVKRGLMASLRHAILGSSKESQDGDDAAVQDAAEKTADGSRQDDDQWRHGGQHTSGAVAVSLSPLTSRTAATATTTAEHGAPALQSCQDQIPISGYAKAFAASSTDGIANILCSVQHKTTTLSNQVYQIHATSASARVAGSDGNLNIVEQSLTVQSPQGRDGSVSSDGQDLSECDLNLNRDISAVDMGSQLPANTSHVVTGNSEDNKPEVDDSPGYVDPYHTVVRRYGADTMLTDQAEL